MRFPESAMPLEVLATCTCRKVVFEGYLDCADADNEQACIDCWKEKYIGDVTMFENSEIPTYEGYQYEDGMFEETVSNEVEDTSGIDLDEDPLSELKDSSAFFE